MARKKIVLDVQLIERLASRGNTNEDIAYLMGCSADTIERNYLPAVRKGRAHARAALRAAQFKNALEENNATMQIWLGKQLLGQTDKVQSNSEITGIIKVIDV